MRREGRSYEIKKEDGRVWTFTISPGGTLVTSTHINQDGLLMGDSETMKDAEDQIAARKWYRDQQGKCKMEDVLGPNFVNMVAEFIHRCFNCPDWAGGGVRLSDFIKHQWQQQVDPSFFAPSMECPSCKSVILWDGEITLAGEEEQEDDEE